MQKAKNFYDVAIVSVKGSDYRIDFWYVIKGGAVEVMKKSDLIEKSGLLEKVFAWLSIRKN